MEKRMLKKRAKRDKRMIGGVIFGIALILILIILFGYLSHRQSPTENGVTRVLSATSVMAGEEINVKLYINLKEGQTYYLVDEKVPGEFLITSEGEYANNQIRLLEIQNAQSNVFEYSIRAPTISGTYVFFGEYSLEGMNDTADIMGDKKILIKEIESR